MKTKFTFLSILLVCLIGLSVVFVACEKDENTITTYKGQVVHAGTSTPFADLEVKLTDGQNINASTRTDAGGYFFVQAALSSINDSYYFLIGDASCEQKQVKLFGWGQSEVNLGIIEVQGQIVPVIELDTVLAIATNSATFKGRVISDGRCAVTERGFCYAKTDYPTIDNNHKVSGKGIGEFVASVSDLEINSTYYVCAYATNEIGTAYSRTIKFTTSDGRPSVTTTDPGENITSTSIATGGNVTDDYGFTVTARGVVYSTLPYPTLENASKVASGSGIGYFSANITNVSPVDNTYYIRAYATNSNGTSYGEQIVITPERFEYLNLPTIIYGGYKYHVYKDMGKGDWNTAKQLCEDLTFAGYSDWYLPDEYELVAMIQAKIDGWYFEQQGLYNDYYSFYWTSSSTSSGSKCRCVVEGTTYGYGKCNGEYSRDYYGTSNVLRFRAVRKDKLE